MLNIRLQRVGKRGQAHFRIVVLEHTKKPKGGFLELLGSYDPHKKELNVEKDRVDYWVSKGAQVSPTVNNLLVNKKVWDKPKMESWKPKVKEAVPASTPTAPAVSVPTSEENIPETSTPESVSQEPEQSSPAETPEPKEEKVEEPQKEATPPAA